MPTIVTTTAAITAANSASAARAHQARVTACHALMPDFRDVTATVEQRQAYSDCVDLIYPQELSAGGVFVVKALILAAFIGAIVGAVRGARSGSFGIVAMYGFMGVFLGPMVVAGLAGVWYGGKFLFA